MGRVLLAVGAVSVLAMGATGTAAGQPTPTCSTTLGIAVHGQHVVGDYVSGLTGATLGWPPSGGVVGQAIAGSGAATRGGPGPGFHFQHGFAPGASFCLLQSNSPGRHLGP